MKNANKPAFATAVTDGEGIMGEKGLSKREIFAMAAMQGICSQPGGWLHPETVAAASILVADELLKQLEL